MPFLLMVCLTLVRLPQVSDWLRRPGARRSPR
jgi:hypothetical protein